MGEFLAVLYYDGVIMFRGTCLALVLVNILVARALALSIGYGGPSSSMPFEVTLENDGQPSFDAILQVVNHSTVTVVVLSWQLELQLRPLQGAQGSLLFHDATAPPDSLFGQEPGPMSDLSSPSDRVLAFDGDTTKFVGEPVAEQMARNILQLTLMASPDAAGAFQLVTPEFDPASPDTGSSWFEAEGFEPQAFDNSALSAFPGFVLLGTINIDGMPRPGDYDSDGEVDTADYDLWKTDFGNSVSTLGEGADGNRDGIIDAADYVIWRANVPTMSGVGNEIHAITPEPGNLALVMLCLAAIGCFTRGPQRRLATASEFLHTAVRR